jgi:hypothetical protein
LKARGLVQALSALTFPSATIQGGNAIVAEVKLNLPENLIGRLRRRLKKQSNLAHLSLNVLKHIERQMNQTPRKCLQFRTPVEVWKEEAGVALQS